MLISYEWCMGTWHCTTDTDMSEWILHTADDVDDPNRESLLNVCRENKAFKEVSVNRNKDGKVESFVFESVGE